MWRHCSIILTSLLFQLRNLKIYKFIICHWMRKLGLYFCYSCKAYYLEGWPFLTYSSKSMIYFHILVFLVPFLTLPCFLFFFDVSSDSLLTCCVIQSYSLNISWCSKAESNLCTSLRLKISTSNTLIRSECKICCSFERSLCRQ